MIRQHQWSDTVPHTGHPGSTLRHETTPGIFPGHTGPSPLPARDTYTTLYRRGRLAVLPKIVNISQDVQYEYPDYNNIRRVLNQGVHSVNPNLSP